MVPCNLPAPACLGPPRDRDAALAVLREAIESGVDHIDTSDFYGPHVTNQIIREALHPYRDGLTIVTKVGAVRGDDGSWNPAQDAVALTAAVHDNLRNLGLEVLDVVNMRLMGGGDDHGPAEGSVEPQLTALAALQAQGLIRHIGLSNATPTQVEQARGIIDIVCVQNHYNLAHRGDEVMIDALAAGRHCLCALLPPWRLHAAPVADLVRGGCKTGRDADASRTGMAAATVS